MPSPRYFAEHLIMPRYLREIGGRSTLNFIERNEAAFLIPVWMEAGFRFTPTLIYQTSGDHRIGVMSLPAPREDTEAYLAVVVGKASDPSYLRYFLWERSSSLFGRGPGTMITEWADEKHLNYGSGPGFTANPTDDVAAVVKRIVEILK